MSLLVHGAKLLSRHSSLAPQDIFIVQIGKDRNCISIWFQHLDSDA